MLSAHWETFLAQVEGRLPKFVVEEVEAYLRCGLLCYGFVEAECRACGHKELIAFSCKKRAFCSSCIGRRMSETAAHLVSAVLPEVPMRQWVASYSWQLRYLMGYDRELASEVLSAFVQSVRDRIAHRVKKGLGLASVREVQTGAVLCVQRFDSALRLNVHAHSLVLDGGYVQTADGLVFHPLGEVTGADVQWVAERAAARTDAILRKHGRTPDEEASEDRLAEDEPVLCECYAQAIRGAGTARVLAELPRAAASGAPKLLAQVGAVNVHAERALDGRDRSQLERLCSYMMRPPIAQERLTLLRDGRVHYAMKRVWRDGTSALVLEPMELVRRLCALVPPPRFHLVRYFGVLAAGSSLRAQVVPKPAAPVAPEPSCDDAWPDSEPPPSIAQKKRMSWSKLLAHVFKIDVTACSQCGGPVRIREAVTRAEDVRQALRQRGLAIDPPKRAPARPPPHDPTDGFDAA